MFKKTRIPEPAPDPKELLVGTCVTCRTKVEKKRGDLAVQKRLHFSEMKPACECPACKATIYLAVKR